MNESDLSKKKIVTKLPFGGTGELRLDNVTVFRDAAKLSFADLPPNLFCGYAADVTCMTGRRQSRTIILMPIGKAQLFRK